jgi:predicted nucleotidyltransferase
LGTILSNQQLNTTAENILKTLGYFDLFQYPLTRDEICRFHADEVPHSVIFTALEELVKDRSVFKLDEFFSLKNDFSAVHTRRNGNILAIKQMKIAGRVARLLSTFPYVKGIAVSGSLSKNFANEKTDIDFFIVTATNRLWIARTFMHLYKKLTFLTGRQHWFCMNYYVDEAGLEITEKNIFTAMEIVTLVPMQGKSSLDNFNSTNDWVKKYFPVNCSVVNHVPEIKGGVFRKLIEKILGGKTGDAVENWLMNITGRRWQKKAERHQLNSKGICMSMIVGRHFSKPDPRNFQDKVVERYHAKVQQLLQQKNTSVSLVF